MEKLAVVIPVYNEEGAIAEVLTQWVTQLRRLGISFTIFAFNDGSKDKTLSIMQQKSAEFPEVKVQDQKNQGHGPTILNGYLKASEEGFDWIFQIDGDNEMSAEDFEKVWSKRHNYDFLIAGRSNRQSPLPRRIVSAVSYLTVRACYGKGVHDVNSPYRLMRTSFFASAFKTIPRNTFAPNVVISGIACAKKARIYLTTAQFRSRKSGTVSIKKWKLVKAAYKSFRQTIDYSQSNKGFLNA